MMIFFFDVQDRAYARYGGRDAQDPDRRQSLAGLRSTMRSVLEMHGREDRMFAPASYEGPRYLRELGGARRGGCLHCHQVKELIDADLLKAGKWSRDRVWRYPLPENVGIELDVDRSNVVKSVRGESPAATAGLRAGDILRRLNGTPIHSFADAQFALDRSPKTGTIDIAWQRGDQATAEQLTLGEGWRKTTLTWRPSIQHLIPTARLYGRDLNAEERRMLGLTATQLAFRQNEFVPTQAKKAGIRAGDIVLGVDDRSLAMDVVDFVHFVQRNYLIGDRVTVNLLRDGKRLNLEMELMP